MESFKRHHIFLCKEVIGFSALGNPKYYVYQVKLKPTKYFIYRHIITLGFLILLGLRFGKLKGILIVLVVYLALNMDFVRWLINSFKKNS